MSYPDIGMSPDYGRPDEIAAECPECGSTDVEGDGTGAYCRTCKEWFAVGPDPHDYPEYDR